nr:ICP4-like protein [Cedratvirus plubellavi]
MQGKLYSDCVERGCTEEEWKELAQRDYGVPFSFFDNKSTDTSAAQRYIEIATYFVLSPYSRVVLYREEGVIEGVYESGAGFLEAIRRNSIPMVRFFFPRLTAQVREYVGQVVIDMDVSFYIQAWVEAMTLLFPNYSPGYSVRKQLAIYEKEPSQLSATELFFLIRNGNATEDLYQEGLFRLTSASSRNAFNKLQGREFFISVIESGNLEHVNQLLSSFTSLPQDYTLGDPLPHTASKEERNYARGYMQAACFSAEVELVDFFLAYFYPERISPSPERISPSPERISPSPERISPSPERISPSPERISPSPERISPSPERISPSPERISPSPERTNLFPECVYSLLSGYSVHRKVIQVYSLLPRIELNSFQVSAFASSGNLDFILYYLSRVGGRGLVREIVQKNFGNIPVLVGLLPLLSASEVGTLAELGSPYPLSTRILQDA